MSGFRPLPRSRLVMQFVDRFMADGRNTLTGHDASEGALYILYFALLALHPRSPPCLAVDNIDQALNPRLAQKLMAALCSWTRRIHDRRQWLITAHNPAVLDGLPSLTRQHGCLPSTGTATAIR